MFPELVYTEPFSDIFVNAFVAFPVISSPLAKHCLFRTRFGRGRKSGGDRSVEYGGSSIGLGEVPFDQVPCRADEQLFRAHFCGRFILTASLGQWRISKCIVLLTLRASVEDEIFRIVESLKHCLSFVLFQATVLFPRIYLECY
jgi:hypothetical protein